MGFTEALRLVVDADTRGAVQGVEKLGAAADRELSRSEKSLDKWGHRLTSLGTGMIAFGGAALVGLGALARESEEANLATVKLQNTIDKMPKLAGQNIGQFTDLATSIQKVTAADADAIVAGEAMLGTFNLTAQQIRGITPLVVDYARKFGIDIPDAAIQVGKALDGQVGALKRNGVSIDEVLFKTDRYKAVNEALQNQVGGFAEAEGKTFAGSLERMKNELGDLAEGVGGGAVDAFTSMFSAVEKAADALESISPGAQNAIGKIATFGAVGLVAAGGLNVLVGTALTFASNIKSMGSGISDAVSKLGGLKAAAGLAAGAAGLAGVVFAIKSLTDAAEAAQLEDFVAALNSTTSASEKSTRQTITNLDAINSLSEGFESVLDKSVPAAEQFIAMAEAMGIESSKIAELKQMLEEKKQADIGGQAAQAEYNAEVQEGVEATDAATESVKAYSDQLKALFDPLFGVINAQQQLDDANAAVTGAEMELAAAIHDHGANSIEAMEATDKLRKAQLDASSAAVGQQAAMDQLATSVRNHETSLESARVKLQSWVSQGLITQATADATTAAFARMTGQINAIPREINIVTRTSTIAMGTRNVPLGRARGGPVDGNRVYEVVEQGEPELLQQGGRTYLIPSGSGNVVPLSGMNSMAGVGGGGSITVIVNNPIVASEAEFQRMVTRAANRGLAAGTINVRGRRVA
jgi:hypothetical protein